MANVAHSTLTGADLHEPKGAASAASGTVYISDGLGSGSWGTIATALNFTGMIADFAVPVAPAGWLECDGSAVSRTTYADLFTAVTIQQSGTRTSGSAVITGLSSTANMKAGYYVGGSGIANGTTILSVDSGTQITMDANAVSSGTSTVIVAPCALGDGSTTFNILDTKTSGKFRRSRTSSLNIGTSQTDQNQAHTHSGTTSGGSAHTHSVTDTGHTHTVTGGIFGGSTSVGTAAGANPVPYGVSAVAIASATTGISLGSESSHTHTYTTSSSGGTEARPTSVVVMTCVKY